MSRRPIAGARLLITGASQGIGRALAEAAALQGAKVLAAARSDGLLDKLARETQGRIVTGTRISTRLKGAVRRVRLIHSINILEQNAFGLKLAG